MAACLGPRRSVGARALLLGERIDTRRFDAQEPFARAPLTISVREGGVAVLFRYGVIVLMNVSTEGEKALIERLSPMVIDPFEPPESEEARIDVGAEAEDQIDINGTILVKELTLERLQLIANVLAKSLILGHYEGRVAIGFDRVEPLAEMLRRRGRLGIGVGPLLRQIGNALLVQHKMVGRVETGKSRICCGTTPNSSGSMPVSRRNTNCATVPAPWITNRTSSCAAAKCCWVSCKSEAARGSNGACSCSSLPRS